MKILTNKETIEAISTLVKDQGDQPTNVRVYIAGMG